MTVAWMLYALVVGALITSAAASAEWALKSTRQSVRFVWVTAIAMTLLLTLAAPLRSPNSNTGAAIPSVAATEAMRAPTPQPTLVELLWTSGRAAIGVLVVPVQKSMEYAKAVPVAANVAAGVFWVLSALGMLMLGTTVYARSMRASSRWPRMNLLGQSVRVAPDVGPAVMGVAPPEIVIPRWVLSRNIDEQRLVLEHEGEHVRAHDPLMLVFACVAVALMPWNPAVWYMWSRLRLAVELDCDRRVLLRGVQKPVYGELLVALSGQRPWGSLAMPAFSWGTSHLEKRLVAMTSTPSRYNVVRVIASTGIVAVTLLAACSSEMPTAAQVQAMDVGALAARVPLTDSTVYFVNGRAVSKVEGYAISSGDIGSVEVTRASAKNSVAQVHVTLVSDSVRGVRLASKSDTTRIVLRGTSGGATAAAPLIILDGVMMDRTFDMNSIKPTDIEAIEVLKGPAAASLYGEKGVNGVISIKRKK